MPKKIATPILLLLATLSCSSQKVTVNGLIKSESYVGADHKVTDIYNYTYDSLGRISTKQWIETGYPSITFTYRYYRDSLVFTNTDTEGHIGRSVFVLNAKGYAINNGESYDEQGYLIQTKPAGPDGEYTTINTIMNGDAVLQKNYVGSILIDSTITTYYSTTDPRKMGMDYEGHPNKHLIKTLTCPWKGSQMTLYYSYKFDAKGRVKSMNISSSPTSTGYTIYEYSYFD